MSGAPSPSTDDPGRAGRGLLTHSVGAGRHALNRASDVRTVQHLLNMAIPGGSRLAEDGRCDALLVERIKAFQVKALHFQTGDGRVDPGGRTLAGLVAAAARAARPPPPSPPWYAGGGQAFDSAVKSVEDDWRKLEAYLLRGRTHPAPTPTLTPHPSPVAKTPGVTADQLRQIMPHAGKNADLYLDVLNDAMATHQITAPEQRAALLAQISNETGDLHRLVENLNYSALRITQVWPRHFRTLEAAQPYAHNPEKLANKVYASILKNGDEASGDGYRYRGRGFLQVTGRLHYREMGFENDPDRLADPRTAADSAANFWRNAGLNPRTRNVLDRSDFNAVTKTVNGGQIASDGRWEAYQRAVKALHCGMN